MYTHCLVIIAGFLMRCAVALSGEPQAPAFTPEELMKKTVPPEKWPEVMRNLAKIGGVLNLPDFWDVQDDPESIFRCAQNVGEPYEPKVLNAMTRVLKTSPIEKDRMRAAALLYRYGQPEGRVYLMRELKDRSDGDAATVLAMNHEDEAFAPVLKVFQEKSWNSQEIIMALGTWNKPEAAQALFEAFDKRPLPGYLFALSLAGAKKAAPLLGPFYEFPQSEPLGTIEKWCAAAAMARLGVRTDRYVALLIEELKIQKRLRAERQKFRTPPVDDKYLSPHAVVRALGVAGGPKAIEALLAIVDDFVQTLDADPKYQEKPWPQIDDDYELVALAAGTLAKLQAKTAVGPLVKALKRIPKYKTEDTPYRQRNRVAYALLRLKEPAAEAAVKEEMGENWLRRALARQKLKSLPSSLLPKDDRFEGLSYNFLGPLGEW